MKSNIIKKKDSNASASAFGWEFQISAAIYMMLKNIRDAETVKVEGKTEDIEIYLSNGNVIYSQAKSFYKDGEDKNAKHKLYNALRTLNNASESKNATKLVYITNSFNPFGIKDSDVAMTFYGLKKVNFLDFPDKCCKIINNAIENKSFSNNFTQNFSIWILPFYGEGDNKYQILKTEINEFLSLLDLGHYGIGQEVMSIWQRSFGINATERDRDCRISKKEMIWPVIVRICCDIKCDDLFDHCDEGLLNEVSRQFKEIIDNMTERFDFTTRVLGLYQEYREVQQNMSSKDFSAWFVNNRWVEFKDDFYIDGMDTEVLEVLTKLIIKKIINVRYSIIKIKKEVML